MRSGYIIACLGLVSVVLFASLASAADPYQWTDDIAPQDFAGVPLIPISDTESMDITIDSDIPLTVFIIDAQEFYYELISLQEGEIENFTGYVQKYEDVTSKEITQDYDSEKSYYVIMYNPSETETATVTVDYQFWEDITGEIIDDAASNACCLLTMGAATIGVMGILAVMVIAKRRK